MKFQIQIGDLVQLVIQLFLVLLTGHLAVHVVHVSDVLRPNQILDLKVERI